MKRKFVLRLLAGVMAATLVVTGVPGTALTGIGIESVYAEASPSSVKVTEQEKLVVVTGVTAGSIYAIVKKSDYAAVTDDTTFQSVQTVGGWKTGVADTPITFTGLSAGTEYVVLEVTSSYAETGAPKAGCFANHSYKNVTTLGTDISDAVVVLEQSSYTFSAKAITPKVASITVGETKITGDDIAKYFTINPIDAGTSVTKNASFTIDAKDAKYSGTKTVTGVEITQLDITSAAADAFVTDKESGGTADQALNPVTYGGTNHPTVYLFAEGAVVTQGAGATATYEVTYENASSIGKATVTVTGKGNYTGSISRTYNIVKGSATLSNSEAIADGGNDSGATATTSFVTANSITAVLSAKADNTQYEFAISTSAAPSSWNYVSGDKKDRYTFTNLTPGTTYYVVARKAATEGTDASANTTAKSFTTSTYDLSTATIELFDSDASTTKVTDTLYTYNESKHKAVPTVKIGGTDLLVASTNSGDFEITYQYKNADGSWDTAVDGSGTNDLKKAGEIKVTVRAKGKSTATTYSGEISATYVINKIAIKAKVTQGTAILSKDYDGTDTLKLEGVTITKTDGTLASSDGELATVSNATITVKLASPNVGKDIAVKEVTSYSDTGLDNYAVTFDVSDLKVEIKQTAVTYAVNTVAASGTASGGTVTYGQELDLKVTNTANLAMTYTVADKYKDYIDVTSDGIVTMKKYSATVNPVVTVSVPSETTTNYDSSKTGSLDVVVTLQQATLSWGTKKDYSNNALDVRIGEDESNVIAAIGAYATYTITDNTQVGKTNTKKISFDSTNATFEYSTSTSGPFTEGLPTTANTYYVRITYTGSNADCFTPVTSTGDSKTIKIALSTTADKLVDESKSEAPVISGPTEKFTENAAITITAAEGADIYYTTDGSAPTTSSTKYTGAFVITDTATVRAIAVETGKAATEGTAVTFTRDTTTASTADKLEQANADLEQAKKDLETAQKAAEDAESAKADAVKEAEKAATAAAEKAAAEKIAAAEKAQKDAEDKAAAAEKAKTEAQAAQKAAEDKAAAATTAATKVGDTVKVDGNTYKVTNVKSKTVSFAKVKKNAKTVNIVSSVEINGVTYKVTSIAASAFKGDKKLTSVTIPATVKTIGKNAFNGCTKLKTITINSSKITKIGSKAFSGVSKKAVVKAPSKKVAAYKKLLKKAKFTGSVKKA